MLILLMMMLPYPIPHVAVIGAISYFLYKRVFTQPSIAAKPDIHKKDYKKDTVYLYQFNRAKNVACSSPFCLKIEVLCRTNNIPYEICVKRRARSRNGTVPFIELNGEHIADSDLIEQRLRKHFNIPDLSEAQEAQATSISRLANNHLFYVLLRYKIAVNHWWLNILRAIGTPERIDCILLPVLKVMFFRKMYYKSTSAIGDFEPKELNDMLYRDLRAIHVTLEDKKFLFGDKMTAADATVFAHLASVYYLGIPTINDVLDKDFPSIVEYLERVRKETFPNDFTI